MCIKVFKVNILKLKLNQFLGRDCILYPTYMCFDKLKLKGYNQ